MKKYYIVKERFLETDSENSAMFNCIELTAEYLVRIYATDENFSKYLDMKYGETKVCNSKHNTAKALRYLDPFQFENEYHAYKGELMKFITTELGYMELWGNTEHYGYLIQCVEFNSEYHKGKSDGYKQAMELLKDNII